MAENEPLSVYDQVLKDRMKALRAKKRLTQRNVADSCQVHVDTYKKWEKRGRPPLNRIERLANTLGVTIARFISGREQAALAVETPVPVVTGTTKKKRKKALRRSKAA